MAAPGYLLGENRTAHNENRYRMGSSTGGNERQQDVRVAGQFGGEKVAVSGNAWSTSTLATLRFSLPRLSTR